MLVNLMDEGYILSNKYRKAIFYEIASGESNINYISKKHRIIRAIANKTIYDLMKNDIINKKNNRYVLSKKGEKIKEIIKD